MKRNFFRFLLVLFLIAPLTVKADISERLFYTSISNEIVKSDEELGYFVEYKSRDGMNNEEHKTFYVTYDSSKLSYIGIDEYETQDYPKFDVSNETKGVLKVTFTATKDVVKDFSLKMKITFKPLNDSVEGLTIIKITPSYIYEKLTCEDCDGFWLGDVAKGNEERYVIIAKNTKQEETTTTEEEKNNDIATPTEEEKGINDYIAYISLGLNGILLIVLIAVILKKNN